MTENSGRLAYDAYARAKGLDSRSWDELPDDDKAGWQLVAEEADRLAAQGDVLLDASVNEASRPVEAEGPTPSEDDYDPRTENGEPDVVTRSRRKS